MFGAELLQGMLSSCIRGVSRLFVGTLLPERSVGKFFGTKNFANHGRHAAFEGPRGEKNIMTSSWIHVVPWEPCFWNVRSGHFSARQFLQGMGAAQRLRRNAGGARAEQKSWQVSCIRALSLEPCSFQGVLQKFLAVKFLQSMGATQRFKHEVGKQKRAKIMGSSGIRGLLLELCSCRALPHRSNAS